MPSLEEMYGEQRPAEVDLTSECYMEFIKYYALHWAGHNKAELWAGWVGCWGIRDKLGDAF